MIATTPPYGPDDVSLLGTGAMGRPMAAHLVRALGPVRVWNRTRARAHELANLGARVVDHPAQAATPVVLTMLPDLPQVVDVVERNDGVLAGWATAGIEEPVLVVHGTVSPMEVREYANALRQRCGAVVVDAPVSGGTIGAERGDLSVMAGGDEEVVDALGPLFAHYAGMVRRMGAAGAGQMAKLCNQVVVAGTVGAVSEAVLLARRAGLDVAALLEVLGGGLAASELLRQKGCRWLEEDYTGGGSAANQLKDLRFVLGAAQTLGAPLPVSGAVTDLFAELVAAGEGELDHTAAYRALQRRSGDGATPPAGPPARA